jgi:rSAM/selenodomain-associated transferase 1
MNPRECLIIFTRYPEPGTTKTRLIPRLGSKGAADLQRQMTEHVLTRSVPVQKTRGLTLEIRHDGGDAERMQRWLGAGAAYRCQGEGDIGERMARAFRDAHARGHASTVVIGADIPGITADVLNRAFDALAAGKTPLGPASDGGYYLIGLPRESVGMALTALFDEMAWGTAAVLPETCERLGRLGMAYTLLEMLDDVDRPEDLPIWERFR